jgi:hypothetical protein
MRLADWADSLEREGLAELATFHGKEVTSLRPRIAGDVAGLVSIACDVRSAYVQFWRSVSSGARLSPPHWSKRSLGLS